MAISRKTPTRRIAFDPPRVIRGDVPPDPRPIASLPEPLTGEARSYRAEDDELDAARRDYWWARPAEERFLPVSAINTRRARYERIVVVVLVLLVAAALITILAK